MKIIKKKLNNINKNIIKKLIKIINSYVIYNGTNLQLSHL